MNEVILSRSHAISSVHPRWLIKFEGPYKDEEVYEHILVKVGDEDEEGVDGDADADDEGPESSEGRISDVSDPAVLPLPATTDAPLLGSSEGSDSSTDPRAQRSKRRQVKIETKGPKNVKKQRKADDGNCLKVKLLTGTLYLYRGKHARAEFVRRV